MCYNVPLRTSTRLPEHVRIDSASGKKIRYDSYVNKPGLPTRIWLVFFLWKILVCIMLYNQNETTLKISIYITNKDEPVMEICWFTLELHSLCGKLTYVHINSERLYREYFSDLRVGLIAQRRTEPDS